MRRHDSVLSLFWLAVVLAGFLASAKIASASEPPLFVRGEPAPAIADTKTMAQALVWRGGVPDAPAKVRFAPVAESRIAAARENNLRPQQGESSRARQIGIMQLAQEEAEDDPDALLVWRQVKGGRLASVRITTPGARAVRVRLRLNDLGDATELRFAGSNDVSSAIVALSLADIAPQLDPERAYWTPLSEGDTQLIELFQPDPALPVPAMLQIVAVSHLYETPKDALAATKALAAACNVDTACVAPTTAFTNAKNTVAEMVFQIGSGTYSCTGTLVNDSDGTSFIPFFFTANHCIGDQSSANSLITYWFYENPTCGVPGTTIGQSAARYGGATLLFADPASDIAFLRLNESPPTGSYYSGWDARALAIGSEMSLIHHPAGDAKKYTRGLITGQTSLFTDVAYLVGSAEGGSSGGALLTFDGTQYFLRGGLYAGTGSCANSGLLSSPDNHDIYSRLDLAFPSLRRYLVDPQPVATPLASANGTISPSTPQKVAYGTTKVFTLTPAAGYAVSVGGTCGGILLGNKFTTGAVTADCTVDATFTQSVNSVRSFTGTGTGIIPDSVVSGPQTPTGQRVVSFAVSGFTQSLIGISVGFNASHTYLGDLRATLTAPGGGPSVDLFAYPGVGSVGTYGYTTDLNGSYLFGDDLGGSLCQNAAFNATLPSGGYGATVPGTCNRSLINPVFSGLTPAQINGTWQLTFYDGSLGNTGQVSSATLNLSISAGGSIGIVGPDTLNANAYMNYPYKVRTTYGDGSFADMNASWSIISSAAQIAPATGLLTVGGLGGATLTATVNTPTGTMTFTKVINIELGADPNQAIDLNCTSEPAIAAPNSVVMVDTAAYTDMSPLCGSVVLVAHRLFNRLQAVDLSTGLILANWPLGARPESMLRPAGGKIAYVVTNANEIVRIDLATKAMTSANVPGDVRGLAFGESGEVWVLIATPSQIYAVSITRFAGDTLALLGNRPLNTDGWFIQYDPEQRKLFILVQGYSPSTLSVFGFSPATGDFTPVQSSRDLGSNGRALALSRDLKHLAMAVGGGNAGYVIYDIKPADITTRAGSWDTGPYPAGADFRFDSGKFLTHNYDHLQIFDVATHIKELDLLTLPCSGFQNVLKWSPTGRNAFVSMGCSYTYQYATMAIASVSAPATVSLIVQKAGGGQGAVVSIPAGISCGLICASLNVTGGTVTLTATASPGSRFIGWSVSGGGAGCPGTGACQVTLAASTIAVATFELDQPPGPPTAVTAVPGNGRATFTFSAPVSNGSPPVASYTLDCNAGAVTAVITASPVVVTGLANGTTYNCTISASNLIGMGAPSAPVNVTPSGAATLALVSVASRKAHGAAGTFGVDVDINAPIDGAVSVEPRAIGTGHTIVFTFSDVISAVGGAGLTDAADVPLGLALPPAWLDNQVTVTLTNVPDASRAKVKLTGVNGLLDTQAAIGFLFGDTSNSRTVTAADIAAVKARVGTTAMQGNFRADVDASGAISSADLVRVKARTGSRLP